MIDDVIYSTQYWCNSFNRAWRDSKSIWTYPILNMPPVTIVQPRPDHNTGNFVPYSFTIRPSKKKKKMFLVRISIKKKRQAGGFFCYLLFRIACFLYTFLPSPRDMLELLGQILIKRNIRYWLKTSVFNFDTHKGLTVKIYIILVCTQQQWALHILDVIRTPS